MVLPEILNKYIIITSLQHHDDLPDNLMQWTKQNVISYYFRMRCRKQPNPHSRR